MEVLQVATEMYPFFKIGGLGDVIGSLPLKLSEQGLDVVVVIPLYKEIDRNRFNIRESEESFSVYFNGKVREVSVFSSGALPVPVYFLSNPEYIDQYNKVAIAGNQAEVNHYAFFSRAVVEWIGRTKRHFDIIHLHDWHVGLVPRLYWYTHPCGDRPKFIFTIHNLGYHGFSETSLVKRLGIKDLQRVKDDPYFDFDAREDDQLDLLLQGLLTADFVTTVSPTYAKEIQTPAYCEGLCDVLRIRSDRLRGILNGINYRIWNPAQDQHIYHCYDLESVETGKLENKSCLQQDLGLSDHNVPLIGSVGRLDPGQKGLDLLCSVLEALLDKQDLSFQFVLLGDGDSEWARRLEQLAIGRTSRVSVNITYDETLAHRIYAASDIMLIPSRYEPCGLVQMIAMRYGAIPVVRATGGLNDTVEDLKSGFVFKEYEVGPFMKKVAQALSIYLQDQKQWNRMIQVAMVTDFSWEHPAREYRELYEELLK